MITGRFFALLGTVTTALLMIWAGISMLFLCGIIAIEVIKLIIWKT